MNLPYLPLGALHNALTGIQQIGTEEADGGCSVAQLRAWMITHPSVVIEERATSAEAIAQQLQIDKLAVLSFRGGDGLSSRDISTARIQLLGLASVYLSRMNLLCGLRPAAGQAAASRGPVSGISNPLTSGTSHMRPGALDAASIPSRIGTELRDYAPHTGLGVDQQAMA